MLPRGPLVTIAVLLLPLTVITGCARQSLTITSDPPGALVTLNDEEFGRTPVTRPFTWYGTYDVQVRKDGYQSLDTRGVLIAPWWNWVPLDLIALALPLHDHQRLHYKLEPAATQPADDPVLLRRAEDLRKEINR
jgi:hypothetical protein